MQAGRKDAIIAAVHVLIQRLRRIYQPLRRQVYWVRRHPTVHHGADRSEPEMIELGFGIAFFAGEFAG